MLLFFVGFNVRHFCFWVFLTTGLMRLVVTRRYMSWTCPSESLGCSSDGHEPTADGGVPFNLGIRCSSWGMTGSRRCSLAVLDSWYPWWTLSFMTPLWDCFNCCQLYFQGRYFLILLQSYVAADVILPWQVLWHVQWFVGFSSFFSLSLQDFTWKNE